MQQYKLFIQFLFATYVFLCAPYLFGVQPARHMQPAPGLGPTIVFDYYDQKCTFVPRILIGQGIYGKAVWGRVFDSNKKELFCCIAKFSTKTENNDLIQRESDLLDKAGSHPNIIKKIYFFNAKRLYLFIEYIDSMLRQEIIKKIRNNELFFKEIIAQLLLGLIHLHSKGISHRDIHAYNILINKKGRVSIIDFGMGVHIEEKCYKKWDYKLNYNTPPEALVDNCSSKLDLWQLGVMIYQLLAKSFSLQEERTYPFGYLPDKHSTHDKQKLQDSILNKPPVSLHPSIYPEIQDLMYRLLEKDPDKRPSAAEALQLPCMQETLKQLALKDKDLVPFINEVIIPPEEDREQKTCYSRLRSFCIIS